jgi:DNA-binding protein HU-beta
MTKTDLVDFVADDLSMTKKDAGLVVDSLLKGLTTGLQKDGTVVLTNFGTLKTRDVEAKKGHNPRTGEAIDIAAHKQVYFSAGKGLKDEVNGRKAEPAAKA